MRTALLLVLFLVSGRAVAAQQTDSSLKDQARHLVEESWEAARDRFPDEIVESSRFPDVFERAREAYGRHLARMERAGRYRGLEVGDFIAVLTTELRRDLEFRDVLDRVRLSDSDRWAMVAMGENVAVFLDRHTLERVRRSGEVYWVWTEWRLTEYALGEDGRFYNRILLNEQVDCTRLRTLAERTETYNDLGRLSSRRVEDAAWESKVPSSVAELAYRNTCRFIRLSDLE